MKIYILASVLALGISSCGDQSNSNQQEKSYSSADFVALVNGYPVYELSDEERVSMEYMWEEEMLARDVYLTLLDEWGSRPFNNISKSEQTHINAIQVLLEKYDIPLAEHHERGVYKSEKLTQLYEELLTEGMKSEKDAFNVGITIEELDIADLKVRISTSKEDATAVYNKLLEASYNHLAAFKKNFEK